MKGPEKEQPFRQAKRYYIKIYNEDGEGNPTDTEAYQVACCDCFYCTETNADVEIGEKRVCYSCKNTFKVTQ